MKPGEGRNRPKVDGQGLEKQPPVKLESVNSSRSLIPDHAMNEIHVFLD